MPAPVELALASLLPMVSFLPPDLIALSNSLLAQSRAKAASLKPEEEIARTYACCHIGCNRLKKRLDLEIGKPAPPVKPKVYDKLFRYLDGVLTTPVTPRKSTAVGAGKADGKRTPASTVKRKSAVESVSDTPTTGENRRRAELDKPDKQQDVPDFVMPMVRAICKANRTPAAVPHVLVGATSVAREILSRRSERATDDPPSKRRKRTPRANPPETSIASEPASINIAASKWPALLISLHLLVVAKMRSTAVEDENIQAMQQTSVEAVTKFCQDRANTLPDDIAGDLEGLVSSIEFYVMEAEDYRWLDMEWYQNVPDGVEGNTGNAASDEDLDNDDEGEEMPTPRKRLYQTPLQRREKHGGKAAFDLEDDVGAAGLRPGLGTMFQPVIDWLSDERVREYAQWKKGILREISAIEAEA